MYKFSVSAYNIELVAKTEFYFPENLFLEFVIDGANLARL